MTELAEVLDTWGPIGFAVFMILVMAYLMVKQRALSERSDDERDSLLMQIRSNKQTHEQEMEKAVQTAQQEMQRRQNELEDRLYQSYERDKQELANDVKRLEDEIEVLRANLAQANRDVASLEQRLSEEAKERSRVMRENALLKEAKEQAEAQAEAAQARADTLGAKVETLEKKWDEEKDLRIQGEKIIETMDTQIRALQVQMTNLSVSNQTLEFEDANG